MSEKQLFVIYEYPEQAILAASKFYLVPYYGLYKPAFDVMTLLDISTPWCLKCAEN